MAGAEERVIIRMRICVRKWEGLTIKTCFNQKVFNSAICQKKESMEIWRTLLKEEFLSNQCVGVQLDKEKKQNGVDQPQCVTNV